MEHKATFLSKLELKNNSIYLKILWKATDQELFTIKIYDSENCWSGSFSIEDIEKFRDEVCEEKEEYIKNVQDILLSQINKNNNLMYAYEFSPISGTDCTSFTWKKRFGSYSDTQVLLVHGSVRLLKDLMTEPKNSLIDYLLHENRILRSDIEEYKGQIELLNLDLEKCKSEMELCIDIKNTLESTLYSKFAQLINTKKRRIQLLEDHIKLFEGSKSNVNMDEDTD